MSELTLFLIRFAYLAVLWIFVLSAVSVVRSDMFGARVPEPRADRQVRRKQAKLPKPPRLRRSPTHVLVVEGGNTGERAELGDVPALIGQNRRVLSRESESF